MRPGHIALLLSLFVVIAAAPSPKEKTPSQVAVSPSLPSPAAAPHNVMQTPGNVLSQGARVFPDIPTSRLPVQPALGDDRDLRYHGASYRLDPHVRSNGIVPKIQDSVLQVLKDTDYQPPSRLDHFAWCRQYPHAVNGWSGYVEAFEPGPQGLLVRVRVTPRLSRVGTVAVVTLDAYEETYLFDNQFRFRFLGGERSKAAIQSSFEL